MSGELIRFPRRDEPINETEAVAWARYLVACQRMHDEYPNVNISTCKAIVDTYERFCFLMKRGKK